ncbi:MAG: hypothetical protein KatS3mg090_0054 [Patescibacteria group bacterium]|nr:MAG: hypothetical protein KatS3mg090_0054 [Patescibacteria group bacterium]
MKDVKNLPKAATQQFIEIEDIWEDIVMLKDYSCFNIIEVGAINYWFLSQEEQESVIYSFAEFLNSLSFPVQISILSKKMDISSYLEFIANKIKEQKSQKLKDLLSSYQNFIKEIVKQNTVLEKRFFIVIPFSPLELGVKAIKGKLNKSFVFQRAKVSLAPKRDHILRLLSKIGLKGSILPKQEIVELFHNIYNPSKTGIKLAPVDSYTEVILSTD